MTEQRQNTLNEYFRACGKWADELTGEPETAIRRVISDSRQARPGDLFVAIVGARQDGRRYLAAAQEAGVAAVAFMPPAPCEISVPHLLLNDDYAALGRLAELAYGYPAQQMRVSAVTGTNGKTTVATLLTSMLRRQEREVGLISTIQYEVGDRVISARRTTPTPLELQELLAQMVKAGLNDVVMEASSHALHQRRLGSAQVHAAIFTNLTSEHLDYHHTMEAYFVAKRILFEEYLAPGGHAIINIDDTYGRRLAEELPAKRPDLLILTYGLDPAADVQARNIDLYREGADFTLVLEGEILPIRWDITGRYNIGNALAASAAAWALGLSSGAIHDALQLFTGVPGRLQRIDGRKGIAVFVDYAHTGDAIANCLSALTPHKPGRLVVIFGCGGDRDTTKRPEMARLAAEAADQLIITSDNPRGEDPEAILDQIAAGIPPEVPYHRIADRRAAIHYAMEHALPDDTILIAGKGHECYQEIQGVEYPFNDVEVAREAMAACGLLPEADQPGKEGDQS